MQSPKISTRIPSIGERLSIHRDTSESDRPDPAAGPGQWVGPVAAPRYLVAADTGGTFVDAVIWDLDSGRFRVGKAAATPDDPPRGIVDVVGAAAGPGGGSPDEVLANALLFFNGATVATNAMIERKGAQTGLLITAGFEDTLVIANVAGRTAGLDEAALMDYRRAE